MSDTPARRSNANRRRGFLILARWSLIARAGLWRLLVASTPASTKAPTTPMSAAISWPSPAARTPRCMALHADNTQTVKRGQLLMEMDPSVANVNLAAAEANLARAVRSVQGEFSQRRVPARAAGAGAGGAGPGAAPTISAASRPLATARCRGEELAHARDNVARRRSGGGRGAGRPAPVPVAASPAPMSPTIPMCWRRKRSCAPPPSRYGHMRIVAPVDGVIAQRTVQVGQQVAAGTPLMAVVPLSNVWIDANFKEVQLARMRVGQPVTDHRRHLWRQGHLSRPCRRPGRGLGQRLRAAAAAECLAATGSRSSSACRCASRWIPRNWRSIRCAWAFRVTASVSMSRTHSGPLVTSRVGAGITRADLGEDQRRPTHHRTILADEWRRASLQRQMSGAHGEHVPGAVAVRPNRRR